MPQHLTILTGASRGMGLAMAGQLLRHGHFLLCVSRHANPSLATEAAVAGATVLQWEHDLAEAGPAAARLRSWLAQTPADHFASATLINNAGVIPPIAPLRDSAPSDLAMALRVGLEAPMLLCAAFLGATAAWRIPRKVLNISSGLGRRPMASQSAYCAAKAGMDHFTRCLALDEERQPYGARVCSLAPGVVDTGMQAQLRSAPPDAFPDAPNFAQLQSNGLLSSASDAAARVLAWLERPDFGTQPVADVRGG